MGALLRADWTMLRQFSSKLALRASCSGLGNGFHTCAVARGVGLPAVSEAKPLDEGGECASGTAVLRHD